MDLRGIDGTGDRDGWLPAGRDKGEGARDGFRALLLISVLFLILFILPITGTMIYTGEPKGYVPR